jgi:hypothetical protein
MATLTVSTRNTQDIPIEEITEELEDSIYPGDYHFIGYQSGPTLAPDIGEAGPGPNMSFYYQNCHLILNDDTDTHIEDGDPNAGKMIRMDSTLHELWKKRFGSADMDNDGDVNMEERDTNPFAPFASELDWRIANWVVKEDPGHKAFNRLLFIPGVRYYLYLIMFIFYLTKINAGS